MSILSCREVTEYYISVYFILCFCLEAASELLIIKDHEFHGQVLSSTAIESL